MMRKALVVVAAMAVVLGTAHAQSPQTQQRSADLKFTNPEQDPQYDSLMSARHSIESGKSDEALATIDNVIAFYEAKYPEGNHRWFVSRTPQEALAYMAMAITDSKKGDKRNASALVVGWAEAYYLKGYALVELKKPEDAKIAFARALQLSPFNSQYLSELGNLYQDEKNWTKALELYGSAEAFATFSPKAQEVQHKTRAKRGQGFVLTELNRFDEAEAAYKECLVLDPNDSKSQKELEYVRYVRAQKK